MFYSKFSSVQFSHSVMSDSLQPHESQHTRPPCPSSTPRVHPTHVHWVGDAIQPSHPLSSPSPALNLSQHQGLFQWVSSSHQLAKVLEFQSLMFSSLLSSHYCCLRLEGSVLSTWISVSTYSMNEHCDIFPFKWTLAWFITSKTI